MLRATNRVVKYKNTMEVLMKAIDFKELPGLTMNELKSFQK